MKPSPFFHDLRSAYQAELDDLAQDSEGKDVLRKRLAQKRGEIAFLARMIDFSPEMVAVAFHQGFRFLRPAALDPLLGRGRVDDLPEWSALGGAVALEPWAQPLADVVLAEPSGARFLSLAALLEYQRQHARFAGQGAAAPMPGRATGKRAETRRSRATTTRPAGVPTTPASPAAMPTARRLPPTGWPTSDSTARSNRPCHDISPSSPRPRP